MRIDQSVLAVLSNALADGNAVRLAGQLDRKLYERTDKVLNAAGGTWNRKARAHLFDGDAASRLDEIILTGEIVLPKDDFNFFPTPPSIVERMIDLADVQRGMKVLEPSAGRGAARGELQIVRNNGEYRHRRYPRLNQSQSSSGGAEKSSAALPSPCEKFWRSMLCP